MVAMPYNNNNPVVSVVMPAFNSQHTIKEAVESVLAQSYPHIELVVIDDGSTDSTKDVLASHSGRIRYLYQVNRGPSAARNLGIDNALGNYIAFLDADDVWYPHKIERQLQGFVDNPEAKWGYCRSNLVTEAGYPIGSNFWNPCYGAPVSLQFPAFDSILRFGTEIHTSTVIVDRRFLLEVGHFDESLRSSEDTDVWIRMAHKSPPLFLSDVLSTRRMVDGVTFHERRIAYDSQLFGLRVIEKNLDTFGLSPGDSMTARQALCRGHFNSAFIELSKGNQQAASEHLSRVAEYVEPKMLYQELAVRLAHFALSGARYHPDGPVHAAAILEGLLDNLQIEKQKIRKVSRMAFAEFFAAVAFMYARKSNRPLSARYARKSLITGPLHWKNIGVWRLALNF